MVVKGEYVKLNWGAWGLCVNGKVSPGDTVVVDRPNGTVHRHKVDEVVAQDHGLRLCTIVPVTHERLEEVYGKPVLDRLVGELSL